MQAGNKSKNSTSRKRNYIFISGGVISSVGKGVTTASLGALLQAAGYNVTAIKCDAYLNVDAGTIRPQEHGEVFVLHDGLETDQDLGNYERFLNTQLNASNYITNGQVYLTIINRERAFGYGGEDVEVARHVPEELINRFEAAGENHNADFVLIEIGGTVGEYQNILFIEANRIMKYRLGYNTAHIHVGYLPIPPSVGEMKSKPVQNSVHQLISSGIQPDFLVARSEAYIDERRKKTLAWSCNMPEDHIIAAPNVSSIYAIPELFAQQKFDSLLLKHFRKNKKTVKPQVQQLHDWKHLARTIEQSHESKKKKHIAIVGKYFQTGEQFKLGDVYVSVLEALKHSSWATNTPVELTWIDSTTIDSKAAAKKILSTYDGIVVPGGFGSRGIEGIVFAIEYSRQYNIPYLGLCYGMQLACVEFARNVAGLREAHTTEINQKTKHPIIHIMAQQAELLKNQQYGGTMRKGDWVCRLQPQTKALAAYKAAGWLKNANTIIERHRHRYEFNNAYLDRLQKAGLVFAGFSAAGNLVEIIELPKHKFFMATQYHPEFLSRPFNPHPLFVSFITAL